MFPQASLASGRIPPWFHSVVRCAAEVQPELAGLLGSYLTEHHLSLDLNQPAILRRHHAREAERLLQELAAKISRGC